jgi:integrase/recombinase XerD
MVKGCRVRVMGPLAGHVDGFREDLSGRGYTVQVRDRNLRLLACVSRWMAERELSAGELTLTLLHDFLGARRREGYHHGLSMRALMPLMAYLVDVGAAPRPAVTEPVAALGVVVEEYRRYLLGERALTPAVVGKYTWLARRFLSATVHGGEVGELSASSVIDYVVRECRGRPGGSATLLVTGLRSLLRFLFLAGHLEVDLASAVPRVAHWGGGSLPRALSPATVAALTASCEPDTPAGLRDRAIIVLLARLGLRAGEVAALALDDLDWRAGELVVRTEKVARRDRLPLPVDVGQALVAYLRHRRPVSACRKVFLRLNAPITGLTGPAVTSVVYRACDRCGLPRVGAHRLRHSAATAMLAGGAGLTEIGQVLRHARPDTTAIYAKVDQAALQALVRPWPGDAA